MFKNLLLAILIAVVLTYCAGYIATEWLDVRIQIDQHWIEPFMSILIVTVIVAVLVIVGFVVALSVFGAIVFALFAGLLGIFVAGIGGFWPIVLLAIVIYYLVRDKNTGKEQY